MFIFPPWQHYDEPGRFEYAWLVANRPEWPKVGEYDQSMRRDVSASMIEHGFYRDMGGIPNILMLDQPIQIGIPQVGDLPVYYFIASIPLRIFKYTDITFQLYSVRIISIFFFILTIWAGLQAAKELFPEGHALRWMVPLFMASLPGFLDLMTAVNNDVAEIAFFTLFLFCSFRIIRRGINHGRILALIAVVLLCVFTKSTGWLAAPLSILVILLGLFKDRNSWYVWGILAGLIGILAAVSFSWNGAIPANYLGSSNSMPDRIETEIAPFGRYALGIKGKPNSRIYQMLTQAELKNISGQIATLGVWAWADQIGEVRFPTLTVNNREVVFEKSIQMSEQPKFYAFEAVVPEDAEVGWLTIYPDSANVDNHVYWDAFILAKGSFSKYPPTVIDESGTISGEWGGDPFQNNLRNPSMEIGTPAFSAFLMSLGQKYNLPLTYAWTLTDFQGSGWYVDAALAKIFRTFWGYFGWANIPFSGSKPYRVFFVPVILSLLGIFSWLWKAKKHLPWNLILFASLAVGVELVVLLLRGAGSWFNQLLIPVARYGFPVILPIAIALNCGFIKFYQLAVSSWKGAKPILITMYFAGLLAMNVWAVVTINNFF